MWAKSPQQPDANDNRLSFAWTSELSPKITSLFTTGYCTNDIIIYLVVFYFAILQCAKKWGSVNTVIFCAVRRTVITANAGEGGEKSAALNDNEEGGKSGKDFPPSLLLRRWESGGGDEIMRKEEEKRKEKSSSLFLLHLCLGTTSPAPRGQVFNRTINILHCESLLRIRLDQGRTGGISRFYGAQRYSLACGGTIR